MQMGMLNQKAPELRVPYWIDGKGREIEPLKLADLGDGYKIIYSFQHWCPGCHSRGFPVLRHLVDNLSDKGFGFAAVQTVFEGSKVNTQDKLRANQEQYGLKIPFGHDIPGEGQRHPTLMEDFRTAGTPWFTVIDPDGTVVYADFKLDPEKFMQALGHQDLEYA
jgi:hypothetical protein